MHPGLSQSPVVTARLRSLDRAADPPLSWREFQARWNARVAPAGTGAGAHPSSLAHRSRLAWTAAVMGIVAALTGGWLLRAGGGVLVGSGEGTGGSRAFRSDAGWPRVSEVGIVAKPGENGVEYAPISILQAQASQQWLGSLPEEPAVVRVGTRLAVTSLEDRIAWVDDRLTAERLEGVPPSRLMALQDRRAQLVDSLARVRYAEALAAGLD